MRKKEIFLVVFTAVLGVLYVYCFTDWFAPKTIRMQHSIRPYPGARIGAQNAKSGNPTSQVISFVLDREWKLSEVKVVPLAEWQTNKSTHVVWHLIADSKSAPTKGFVYGGEIKGMHPAERGVMPDPLQPGIVYRLFVRAGKVQGEDDFEAGKSVAR